MTTSANNLSDDMIVIDNFEEQSLNNYQYSGDWQVTESSDAPQGDSYLRLNDSGYHNIISMPGEGLGYYPGPGDTIHVSLGFEQIDNLLFLFGIESVDGGKVDGGLTVKISPYNGRFKLAERSTNRAEPKIDEADYSSSVNDFNLTIDWSENDATSDWNYQLEVTVAKRDGTTVASLSGGTDIGEGGIGIRAGNFGSSVRAYADNIRANPEGDSEENIVSQSATTMTLLPGGSENSQDGGASQCRDHKDDCNDGGDDLDNSMPDYWGKSLDAWFIGDMREDLPNELSYAEDVKRRPVEYDGEEFQAYRMKNHIEIKFPSSDSETIDNWDEVEVKLTDEDPPYVLVEGEGEQNGEDNPIRTLINSPPNEDWSWFEGREKARAIVTRFDSVVESGENDEEFRWSPRSPAVNLVRFEGITGIQGVRVSVIMGGDDTYITKLNEIRFNKHQREFIDEFPDDTFTNLGQIPSWIQTPPTMYTFLDLIVMADGTSVSRVWDSSPYPMHYLYHNGDRQANNGFDKGTGKKFEIGKVQNGEWIRNQDVNRERFAQWWKQIHFTTVTPFKPHVPRQYELDWDANAQLAGTPQAHPVMVGMSDGETLDSQEVMNEFETPLFPWEGKYTVDWNVSYDGSSDPFTVEVAENPLVKIELEGTGRGDYANVYATNEIFSQANVAFNGVSATRNDNYNDLFIGLSSSEGARPSGSGDISFAIREDDSSNEPVDTFVVDGRNTSIGTIDWNQDHDIVIEVRESEATLLIDGVERATVSHSMSGPWYVTVTREDDTYSESSENTTIDGIDW